MTRTPSLPKLHVCWTIQPLMKPWHAPTTRSGTARAASESPASSSNRSPDMTAPDVTTNVCVVGLGYIGLPTAQVLGVDVRPAVVDTINAGEIHIEEANLDLLVRAMVESGSLRAALANAH